MSIASLAAPDHREVARHAGRAIRLQQGEPPFRAGAAA